MCRAHGLRCSHSHSHSRSRSRREVLSSEFRAVRPQAHWPPIDFRLLGLHPPDSHVVIMMIHPLCNLARIPTHLKTVYIGFAISSSTMVSLKLRR